MKIVQGRGEGMWKVAEVIFSVILLEAEEWHKPIKNLQAKAEIPKVIKLVKLMKKSF